MSEFDWLSAALDELAAGRSCVLCTVLRSEGSVPRGAGARMTVLPDGTAAGTVGGGRIELMAHEQALALCSGGSVCERHYEMRGPGSGTGMVCGGAADILFTPLTQAERASLETLRRLLRDGQCAQLALYRTPRVPALSVQEGAGSAPIPALTGAAYTERLGADGAVWLFGGGHVGRALAPLLISLDFRVTVLDDRPGVAVPAHFPGAAAVVQCDYGNIAASAPIGPRDYVVVMTAGHAGDIAVVRQALACKPAYLGCMGSHAKCGVLRQALSESGFSPAQIDSVRLPIGLPIGARTPAEIAVSVAAELIAARRARSPDSAAACPS